MSTATNPAREYRKFKRPFPLPLPLRSPQCCRGSPRHRERPPSARECQRGRPAGSQPRAARSTSRSERPRRAHTQRVHNVGWLSSAVWHGAWSESTPLLCLVQRVDAWTHCWRPASHSRIDPVHATIKDAITWRNGVGGQRGEKCDNRAGPLLSRRGDTRRYMRQPLQAGLAIECSDGASKVVGTVDDGYCHAFTHRHALRSLANNGRIG